MSGETKQRLSDLEAENANLRKQLEDRVTLRDQFALVVLPELIARHRADLTWSLVVPTAYAIADSMIEVRKNG